MKIRLNEIRTTKMFSYLAIGPPLVKVPGPEFAPITPDVLKL
jgi:hypothetical protein